MTSLLAANVTLAWSPSFSPAVTGYYVYSGSASGRYTSRVFAGNTSQAILSNLVAGRTYYFAGTSCDASGRESIYSNEAVYSVPATATLPVALVSPSFAGKNFRFTVIGGFGTNFVVEASVNLVNWIPLATNISPFTFIDTNTGQFAKRFYRAVPLR